MKTIGIIGGTTWHSTMDYYKLFNEKVAKRLGGNNAAKVLIDSMNFKDVLDLQSSERLDDLEDLLCEKARKLEKSGAGCLLLGANTMHRFAAKVQKSINIPLIHIADATAKEIKNLNFSKVGLLGTIITMEEDFYKVRLKEKYQIECIIPGEAERKYISDSIYNDFAKGIFTPDTKVRFLDSIDKLITNGAQGIILGCTEIPLLIKQEDVRIPVFDTTDIHAQAAVDYVLR